MPFGVAKLPTITAGPPPPVAATGVTLPAYAVSRRVLTQANVNDLSEYERRDIKCSSHANMPPMPLSTFIPVRCTTDERARCSNHMSISCHSPRRQCAHDSPRLCATSAYSRAC